MTGVRVTKERGFPYWVCAGTYLTHGVGETWSAAVADYEASLREHAVDLVEYEAVLGAVYREELARLRAHGIAPPRCVAAEGAPVPDTDIALSYQELARLYDPGQAVEEGADGPLGIDLDDAPVS